MWFVLSAVLIVVGLTLVVTVLVSSDREDAELVERRNKQLEDELHRQNTQKWLDHFNQKN